MLRVNPQSRNYKWWVFGTIAIGTFISVVDTGSILVALPNIASHFDADLATVQWVFVGYALAISVMLLPMGRLGDIVGRKQVYVSGFAIFVVAAAMGGASRALAVLIIARVFQGVGSAMVQGNGMATIITVFPESERGKALGMHLSVVGTGAIVGTAVGGLLVSAYGWQSVFFVNVAVGLITIAMTALILAGDRPDATALGGQRPSFDWLGAGLSGTALLLILLVVGNGDRVGWSLPLVLGGGALSVLLLAAFIWWELRTTSPMLDLGLFRRKLVALGVAAGWISFLGTAWSRFMMPFYLQRVLEYSPREVGLLMIPPALCMVIVGPLAGRLSDRFGWRNLTIAGMSCSAVAWFILATTLTSNSSVVLVVTMLMLQNAGTGLFNTPNNSSILSAVERSSYGVVSALTQLVRNSANVTSVALATTVVVVTMGSLGVEPSLDAVSPQVADAFVSGVHWVFLLMGVVLVLGALVCLARGDQPRLMVEAPMRAASGDITSD